MPHARSTSIALAIRAGSTFDPPGANGLAHFLEHLIFKATDDYSRTELAAAMQACGNGFDPTTSKETISLSGTVPAHRTEAALHLLASVTQRPRNAELCVPGSWPTLMKAKAIGVEMARRRRSVMGPKVI
ncbi:MAG: hypothetical protein PVSMB1_19830 [Gemmatimonadaceae bacterium]